MHNIKYLYSSYAISKICANVEYDVKIVIKILLAIKKAKQKISKGLSKSLLESNQEEIENKLKTDFIIYNKNIYKNNILIIINCKLLYLDLRDTCDKIMVNIQINTFSCYLSYFNIYIIKTMSQR